LFIYKIPELQTKPVIDKLFNLNTGSESFRDFSIDHPCVAILSST